MKLKTTPRKILLNSCKRKKTKKSNNKKNNLRLEYRQLHQICLLNLTTTVIFNRNLYAKIAIQDYHKNHLS